MASNVIAILSTVVAGIAAITNVVVSVSCLLKLRRKKLQPAGETTTLKQAKLNLSTTVDLYRKAVAVAVDNTIYKGLPMLFDERNYMPDIEIKTELKEIDLYKWALLEELIDRRRKLSDDMDKEIIAMMDDKIKQLLTSLED